MSKNILLATTNKSYSFEITKFINKEFSSLIITTIDNANELKSKIIDEKPLVVISDFKLYTNQKHIVLKEFGTAVIQELVQLNVDTRFIVLEGAINIQQSIELFKAGVLAYFTSEINYEELSAFIKKIILLDEINSIKIGSPKSQKLNSISIGEYSISSGSQLEAVYLDASKIAKYDKEILILGESGVGKEHLAKFIHNESKRFKKPFKVIDLSAYPENIIESTLFGHTKGSFTGATESKLGLVYSTDGGTLFIDEIGNANLNIQAKLLRFIETKQFRMLGSTQDYTADIRIIAATNKPVRELRNGSQFRNDLFNRLDKHRIIIPPFRERSNQEKIELAKFLANKFAKENSVKLKEFDAEALSLIVTHHWPGNIRNLNKIISNAFIRTDGDLITGKVLEKLIETDLSE